MIIGPAHPGHPDAVTYLRAARAFRERDLDAITETIHESRTGNSFVFEDRSISGTDHHVVALQRFGATVMGETQMFEAVSIMRFEGGRQVAGAGRIRRVLRAFSLTPRRA